jgi:hypothetical protein
MILPHMLVLRIYRAVGLQSQGELIVRCFVHRIGRIDYI